MNSSVGISSAWSATDAAAEPPGPLPVRAAVRHSAVYRSGRLRLPPGGLSTTGGALHRSRIPPRSSLDVGTLPEGGHCVIVAHRPAERALPYPASAYGGVTSSSTTSAPAEPGSLASAAHPGLPRAPRGESQLVPVGLPAPGRCRRSPHDVCAPGPFRCRPEPG